MPTDVNYRGRHVKGTYRRGIDSRTPRGPERWARAAHNALTNPLSAAAQLYFDRVSTARGFMQYEEASYPFEHVEVQWASTAHDAPIVQQTRKYVTCNIVCAAMQIQLDFGTTRTHEVGGVFSGIYRRTFEFHDTVQYARWQTNVNVLDTKTLKRNVRCQVCGTTVKRG